MARATTDIDSVCTITDLADEVGGRDALYNLQSDVLTVRGAIRGALDDVVDNLRNRTPPITESNLVDVTELRLAVLYGALERLYRQAATTGGGDDVNARKSSDYGKKHRDTLSTLRPTVTGGLLGTPWGISMHRR